MTDGGRPVPLVADMDGTFFLTDSTEAMIARLARRPLRRLAFARRMRRGDKALAKIYLHRYGTVPLDAFEPRADLHAWLAEQASNGRPVYLATGAPQALADEVAAAYPWLTGVFGTKPEMNLTGPRKADFLRQRFGFRGFDYAGDSWADLEVWRVARHAILCGVPRELAEAAADACDIEREFP